MTKKLPTNRLLPLQGDWQIAASVYLNRLWLFQGVAAVCVAPLVIFPSSPEPAAVRLFIFLVLTAILEVLFSHRLLMMRVRHLISEAQDVRREILDIMAHLDKHPQVREKLDPKAVEGLYANLEKCDYFEGRLLDIMKSLSFSSKTQQILQGLQADLDGAARHFRAFRASCSPAI